MKQISLGADKQLHLLSRNIGVQSKIKQEAEDEFNKLWEHVLAVFEENNAGYFRFVADDGYYLYKQKRAGGVKLDEDALLEMLITKFGAKAAARIWNRITMRKVDPILLEQAKLKGTIPAEVIDSCLNTGPDTFARVRAEWTKEDHNKAVIFGVALKKEEEHAKVAATI